MLFTIRKGKHRARPLSIGLMWKPYQVFRTVTFHPSCAYQLGDPDQYDINKLFGFGFLMGGHHRNSARVGWWYDPAIRQVRLVGYCYINGKREVHQIGRIRLGESAEVGILSLQGKYVFVFKGVPVMTFYHNHRHQLAYRLGLYFGGNRTAPHDITIQITKA